MFALSPEALRRLRVEDLRLSEDELGAAVYRTRDGGDAIRAFEAGKRPVPPIVAAVVLGLRQADRIARGLEPAAGFPALSA